MTVLTQALGRTNSVVTPERDAEIRRAAAERFSGALAPARVEPSADTRGMSTPAALAATSSIVSPEARAAGRVRQETKNDIQDEMTDLRESPLDASGIEKVNRSLAADKRRDAQAGMLLSTFGGRRLAPKGGQILSNALGRSPIRPNAADIGWTDTATGEFHENPSAARNRTEKLLGESWERYQTEQEALASQQEEIEKRLSTAANNSEKNALQAEKTRIGEEQKILDRKMRETIARRGVAGRSSVAQQGIEARQSAAELVAGAKVDAAGTLADAKVLEGEVGENRRAKKADLDYDRKTQASKLKADAKVAAATTDAERKRARDDYKNEQALAKAERDTEIATIDYERKVDAALVKADARVLSATTQAERDQAEAEFRAEQTRLRDDFAAQQSQIKAAAKFTAEDVRATDKVEAARVKAEGSVEAATALHERRQELAEAERTGRTEAATTQYDRGVSTADTRSDRSQDAATTQYERAQLAAGVRDERAVESATTKFERSQATGAARNQERLDAASTAFERQRIRDEFAAEQAEARDTFKASTAGNAATAKYDRSVAAANTKYERGLEMATTKHDRTEAANRRKEDIKAAEQVLTREQDAVKALAKVEAASTKAGRDTEAAALRAGEASARDRLNRKAAQRRAETTAAGSALTNKQRDIISATNAQLLDTDNVIAQVRANPGAFGLWEGALGALPLVGPAAESMRQKVMSSEQRRARSAVYNTISGIIKARAGTAQSEAEIKQLKRFLPGDFDNAEQIIDKFLQFQSYLENLGRGVGRPVSKAGGQVPQGQATRDADLPPSTVRVTDDDAGRAAYDALRVGEQYEDPNGQVRTKRGIRR